jgi:predicted RNase H-like HicB family nuclease
MMTRIFDVIVEQDEDGWLVASVPGLGGCHTQARSLERLMERVCEAIALCLEVPRSARPEFIGISRVEVPA